MLYAFIVAMILCCVPAQRAQSFLQFATTSATISPERVRADSRSQSSASDKVSASPVNSRPPHLLFSTDLHVAPLNKAEADSDLEEDVLRARTAFTSIEEDDGTKPSDYSHKNDNDYHVKDLELSDQEMSPAEDSEAFFGAATSRVERGLFYSCFTRTFSYSCSCGKGAKYILTLFTLSV